MLKKGLKKPRKDDLDDGRVIADMHIDGVPRSIYRRFDLDKSRRKNDEKETIKLSKGELLKVVAGIGSSYLLFGIVFFGLLALLILFCIKVWLK